MIRTVALTIIALATSSLALAKPTPRPDVASPRDCSPTSVIGPSMTTAGAHNASTVGSSGAATVNPGTTATQCTNRVAPSNLANHVTGQGGIIAPTDTHANPGGIIAPTDTHQAPGSPDSHSEPPGSPAAPKY